MRLEILRVRNFALVKEAEIELHPGFNAFTGETGAGKTLILSALKLLLGGRVRWELLGQGESVLEGLFAGADEEVVVRRVLSPSSRRSRIYVNGNLASASEVAELLGSKVSFHGQREGARLLEPSHQLALLDRFGGLWELRLRYHELWEECRQLEEKLRAALEEAQASRQLRERLLEDLEELEALDPKPGEEEELLERRRWLMRAKEVAEAHARALKAIEGARDALSEAQEMADLLEISEELEAARSLLSDALLKLAENPPPTPAEAEEELERVSERLWRIERLKERHRTNFEGLLKLREELRRRLEELEQGTDLKAIEERLMKARDELKRVMEELSAGRQKAARRLEKEVLGHLRDLSMPGAKFEVRLQRVEPGPWGAERIEFLLAPSEAQALLPLRQAASGGELARCSLALELALGEADRTPLFVFDEVDQGVGGRAADALARKLRQLAEAHQVIVVTHLPQVAARAQRQFAVEKVRGVVRVKPVEGEERLREIARMAAGERAEEAVDFARRLLEG